MVGDADEPTLVNITLDRNIVVFQSEHVDQKIPHVNAPYGRHTSRTQASRMTVTANTNTTPPPPPPKKHDHNVDLQEPYHDLYWSVGDGGPQNDPGDKAQNLGEFHGSMVRISVSSTLADSGYEIPASNPFDGSGGKMEMRQITQPARSTSERRCSAFVSTFLFFVRRPAGLRSLRCPTRRWVLAGGGRKEGRKDWRHLSKCCTACSSASFRCFLLFLSLISVFLANHGLSLLVKTMGC